MPKGHVRVKSRNRSFYASTGFARLGNAAGSGKNRGSTGVCRCPCPVRRGRGNAIRQRRGTEAAAFDGFQKLFGDDGIGIDVAAVERGDDGGDFGKGFHGFASCADDAV